MVFEPMPTTNFTTISFENIAQLKWRQYLEPFNHNSPMFKCAKSQTHANKCVSLINTRTLIASMALILKNISNISKLA